MLWSCSNVSVVYGQDDGSRTAALRDITLSICNGERVAIVGPNGSGKSTLALVIAGLLRPSTGEVRATGELVNGPIGSVVFQSADDNLLGGTVAEEIELSLEQSDPGLPTGLSEILSRFQLDAHADRSTSRLSGGEKQLTALACAFASGRPLIVLDEPSSHLDRAGKKLLWRALDGITSGTGAKPAIVMVTQYTDEIEHFDRVIALANGTIVHDGLSAVWSKPTAAPRRLIRVPATQTDDPVVALTQVSQVEMPGRLIPECSLRDVSLRIGRGEAIAVCGPIGAGKTTLGLILAGLITQHAGERTCVTESPVMLIQFPERQLFCKTLEAEVAYGLIARGVSKVDAIEKSRAALRRVGLDPDQFGSRDPFSLSGGQRRRVMLAAAAVIEAPLYILDEPQAALDDEGLIALSSLCEDWLEQGSSYILISHDHEFLRALTWRVLVLDRGRLRFDGAWDGLDRQVNSMGDIGFVAAEKTWI